MKESKSELPYKSNKEIADEKIGKWLSAALEDPTTCSAMKDDINEWFRAIEEERLRTKKKAIKEELYDAVKMEMFKASSALEGIDYEDREEDVNKPVEDDRVEMEVDFTDEELLTYMKMAHERDITFNQFMEHVIKQFLEENEA